MQREKPPEWREKQKGSRGIRRGQRYRLVFQFPIREHYTDTAGFTEHVFALMHLLGFAFAPRIRDLHDKRLFIHGKAERYPGLQSVISTTSLNIKDIETYWNEVLRLAASIKQGTVTASLMMKKLASYPNRMDWPKR